MQYWLFMHTILVSFISSPIVQLLLRCAISSLVQGSKNERGALNYSRRFTIVAIARIKVRTNLGHIWSSVKLLA